MGLEGEEHRVGNVDVHAGSELLVEERETEGGRSGKRFQERRRLCTR